MITLHITILPIKIQAILVRRIPHQQSLKIYQVSDIPIWPPSKSDRGPADIISGLAQYGGWWDGEINWFKSQKASEQRSDVFCSASTGAFTISAFQSITWCPNAFSGFGNGHQYLTSIGGIQANQKQINKDDPLKKYESLASVWLHEWTHLQSSTADQPAYDGKGNSISGKSYGFYGCANLARKSPDGQRLAIANADTYAYFAMAMYLDKWDWSSGIAANSLGL